MLVPIQDVPMSHTTCTGMGRTVSSLFANSACNWFILDAINSWILLFDISSYSILSIYFSTRKVSDPQRTPNDILLLRSAEGFPRSHLEISVNSQYQWQKRQQTTTEALRVANSNRFTGGLVVSDESGLALKLNPLTNSMFKLRLNACFYSGG